MYMKWSTVGWLAELSWYVRTLYDVDGISSMNLWLLLHRRWWWGWMDKWRCRRNGKIHLCVGFFKIHILLFQSSNFHFHNILFYTRAHTHRSSSISQHNIHNFTTEHNMYTTLLVDYLTIVYNWMRTRNNLMKWKIQMEMYNNCILCCILWSLLLYNMHFINKYILYAFLLIHYIIPVLIFFKFLRGKKQRNNEN